MRSFFIVAALALAAGSVAAADHEAGVPLAPAEAAGAWTVESGGKTLCMLHLTGDKAGGSSFGLKAPASCGDALPAGVAAWAPAADGMSLVDAQGQVLIGFHRWSNSLFVSSRSSGEDIQLKRGDPGE